jgi:hypothetical protein
MTSNDTQRDTTMSDKQVQIIFTEDDADAYKVEPDTDELKYIHCESILQMPKKSPNKA